MAIFAPKQCVTGFMQAVRMRSHKLNPTLGLTVYDFTTALRVQPPQTASVFLPEAFYRAFPIGWVNMILSSFGDPCLSSERGGARTAAGSADFINAALDPQKVSGLVTPTAVRKGVCRKQGQGSPTRGKIRRSRAYKQLIEAGMTDAQVAIISGFECMHESGLRN